MLIKVVAQCSPIPRHVFTISTLSTLPPCTVPSIARIARLILSFSAWPRQLSTHKWLIPTPAYVGWRAFSAYGKAEWIEHANIRLFLSSAVRLEHKYHH